MSKSAFGELYELPDPREFLFALEEAKYSLQSQLRPLLSRLLDLLRRKLGRRRLRVIDLGCSYGINSALMRADCTPLEWAARLRVARHKSVTQVLRGDSSFFARNMLDSHLEIIGIDVARNALNYATAVGLIDSPICIDLERSGLPNPIAFADLLLCTGCVGYVGETSFERLLGGLAEGPAVVLSTTLSAFDYHAVSRVLERYGLATISLDDRIRQRRALSASEESWAITEGGEGAVRNGWLLADVYLSAPNIAALKEELTAKGDPD